MEKKITKDKPKSKGNVLNKRALKEKPTKKAVDTSAGAVYDLWGDAQEEPSKVKKYRNKTIVEPPGCSYNPGYDDHQV